MPAGESSRCRASVLLDRDGTIIEECHYLSDPEKVRLIPGVAEGMRALQVLGLPLIIITNQSGIGRGYFDMAAVEAVHKRLLELLALEAITIEGVYICPHAPEEQCTCRKPLPGLALRAAEECSFDPALSFVIGDKVCDVELALNLGATPVLVRSGYGAEEEKKLDLPGLICVDTLCEAAEKIKAFREKQGSSYPQAF
jgi:D-glycero-D-manno-heptose 1,7-bisphosphate phosphatase